MDFTNFFFFFFFLTNNCNTILMSTFVPLILNPPMCGVTVSSLLSGAVLCWCRPSLLMFSKHCSSEVDGAMPRLLASTLDCHCHPSHTQSIRRCTCLNRCSRNNGTSSSPWTCPLHSWTEFRGYTLGTPSAVLVLELRNLYCPSCVRG